MKRESEAHQSPAAAEAPSPLFAPGVVRLPIDFFALGVFFFCAGVVLAPWGLDDALVFFRRPVPLAIVHLFTLGWITSSIMGVTYRYVPALTHRPVRFPRLARAQYFLHAVGVLGMAAHFAIGEWTGLWSAAIVVLLSVAIYAVNMMSCLGPAIGTGVAETGLALSVTFLTAATLWGFLLGLDHTFHFLPGGWSVNLAAHADLALLGWVTLAIFSTSYRFLPAFLLPTIELPRAALWQLCVFAAGVAGMAAVLIAGLPGAGMFGFIIAATLIWYLVIIRRLVGTRRMPIDWTVLHAMVAMGWLVVAAALGLALSITGLGGVATVRMAAAWGAIGLLGWAGNFLVGMSYQIFPSFVTRVRSARKWPPVAIAELSVTAAQPYVLVVYNGGVALAVGALLGGARVWAVAGGTALTVAGLTYGVSILYAVAFAYRRKPPRSAIANPLRILPG